MKKALSYFFSALISMSFTACKEKSKIEMNFPERYEGKTVELISYSDSVILASDVIKDGKAEFETEENDSIKFPLFTQIVIDGRIRAYYIMEKGMVVLADSMSVPTGSPLNDKFAGMLSTMDSIENLDDMVLYTDYAEKRYNENRENVLGAYFGVEWMKYAEPQKVDSFLRLAPEAFRISPKVKYYENFARHRAMTGPGMKYTDFEGENSKGEKVWLSSYVTPGKYTLIDFWASWCPYCIKELPELMSLHSDFGDKGFEIVGVAVRDKSEDTDAMVNKKEIPWKVLYNTQKIPYDIYGFSGIPYHILIDPDGTIISRGENASQIRSRLESILTD